MLREEADNLLDESKNELVEMLCNMSYQIDMLNDKLTAKDEEIERLKENITPYCVDSYFIGYSRAHTKARSIVAMLFWMMKRQKAIYAKRYKELGQHHEQVAYYKGAYENSKIRFKQAYTMLKDTK